MKLDILDDEYWEKLNRSVKNIPEDWNARVSTSIKIEKRKIEKRHGIRIGQTEIRCAICGKPWPFRCPHSISIKQEYNRPMIGKSPGDYREELGIELGMSKEEALEKFLEWQASKKACQRCEGKKYVEFCPYNLICREVMEYESRRQIDLGARSSEDIGLEEAGVGHNEKQLGFDFCEGI